MNSVYFTPTAFLKLPLAVDLPGLLQDLQHCLASKWSPHFNSRDYEGGWDSIALRSQDGLATTILATPNHRFQDTLLLAECPHFTALLACLRCEKESVRLLRQAPGGAIKTHRDAGLGYADGVFRLHIPLVTHPDVQFVVAGHRLPMQAGECWFADFSEPHSVRNSDLSERIHLVIDCIRNTWADDWFLGAGFDKQNLEAKPMPQATRLQTIAQLRNMPGPTPIGLIAQLEAESAAYIAEENMHKILGFLDEIGILWRYGEVPETTFLPGLEVEAGCIVIDKDKLKYPGDILHEAGHIALLPADKRQLFSGDMKQALPEHEGDEIAVILWTYAASLHIGVPLEFVIHDAGYKGSADHLRECFESGTYIGLPLLVWMGLCEDPKVAKAAGRDGFPTMGSWVR